MTLVVALLAQEFVLLATDRRITTMEDSTGAGTEPVVTEQVDSDTKSIILDHRFVMGFAGLGRVRSATIDPVSKRPRRQRLESWLAETLAGVPAADQLTAISEKFGPVCEEQGYTGNHTFLAVGYSVSDTPELIRIDNRTAPHTFYPYFSHLDGNDFLLEYAGIRPSAECDARFRHVIRMLREKYPDRPDFYLKAAQRLFAEVAAESDGKVGASCLITTLPRVAVPVMSITSWLDTPVSDTYRVAEVSSFYPGPESAEQQRSFQPAFIGSQFSAIAVEGATDSGNFLGPIEGI